MQVGGQDKNNSPNFSNKKGIRNVGLMVVVTRGFKVTALELLTMVASKRCEYPEGCHKSASWDDGVGVSFPELIDSLL